MTTTTSLTKITTASGTPIPSTIIKSDCLGRIHVSKEHREKLLDAFDASGMNGAQFAQHYVRDRAMMEVTYCTGMRRSETVGLRITDLIRGDSSIVVHNGKGGKERVVPLGGPAQYWLKRYLAEARPLLILPDEPSDVLFLISYGDGFSAGAWGHAVRDYLTKSGVTVRGGPHLLRHACAMHMRDHGADLRPIQTLLGHSRVDTTEIYTHVSTGRLSSVHKNTHPRG